MNKCQTLIFVDMHQNALVYHIQRYVTHITNVLVFEDSCLIKLCCDFDYVFVTTILATTNQFLALMTCVLEQCMDFQSDTRTGEY